jgi:hypothetical protein
MRRVTILLASFLCLVGLAAAGQQILPVSFGGWTGTIESGLPPIAANSTRQVGATASQQSSALAEYGLVSSESGSYQKGAQSLQVDVYRMKDPSGAYGLLTYLQPPQMAHSNLAMHAFLSENEALILAGNLVVDVHGINLPAHETDLRALLQQVSAHAEEGALPTLWQQLPSKQMIRGTDKYVLGPQTLNQLFPVALGESVGFLQGGEAEIARYRSGKGQATLLLVDLPTPQIATATIKELAGKFDVNGSNPGTSLPLHVKRLMTTVVIVAGAPTDADAMALLDEIQSSQVLTWNEPTPKGKQADIYTIVVGTIIGTGVFCVFSIIAGLAFGGFRLVVKRVLPGKVFDRTKDMQVIQLGLSSKPISADDFYDRSGPKVKLGEVEKNLPDKVALRLFR